MKDREHPGVGRRRLWAGFFVLVSLVLIFAGFLFYRAEAGRIQQQKYQELKTIAELKAGEVCQWRQERLADVNRAIQSPFFIAAVEQFRQGPGSSRLTKDLHRMLQVELGHGMYADVLLLAVDGSVLLSAGPHADTVDTMEAQAIEEGVGTGKTVLIGPYRARSGKIFVDAVGPIVGNSGEPIAILVLRSDPDAYLYPLIQSWPTPSRTAETLLVSREGEEVVHLNDLRHKKGTALALRYPLADGRTPAAQAVLGKRGMYKGKDYRGKEVLADLRPISQSPWFMVAKEDAAEILAESRWRAGVISAFVFLFVLLAAALTAYVYRLRQARLFRRLYRVERSERESQELFRTTLYSIGDAVITTDLSGRVKQMNPVAERLTGWKEWEAEGRPLLEIFRIINETTRTAVESPVEAVLKGGTVVGLANHTVLIARDGSEYPIADSGAPIRAEDGSMAGVVMVFRDQTRERTAERALKESEEKYRGFFTTSRDCVFITPPSGQLTDFNDAALELFGYASREDFLTVPVARLYEQPEEREQFHRLVAEKGYLKEHPVRLKRKDGSVIDALITAGSIKNEDGSIRAFVGTIRDITRQKRTEETLKESEERYRVAIEGSLDGISIIQNDVHAYANQSFLAMFGYSSMDEIIGKSQYDAIHPDDRERVAGYARARQNGEYAPTRYQFKGIKKDGTPIDIEISVSVIRYKGAKAILGYLRDIGERKQAEETNARLAAIVESSDDAIIGKDLNGVILTWNMGAEKIYGYEVTEVIGKSISILVPPDRADEVPGFLGRIRLGKSVEHYETVRRRKDGSLIDISLTVSPVKDGAGKIVGASTIARDITEGKRTVEFLRKNEEWLRMAQEAAGAGTWEWDIETGENFWSDALCRLYGLDPNDCKPSYDLWLETIHPDDRERTESAVLDAAREGTDLNAEWRVIYPDHTVRWLMSRGRPLRDAAGRVARFIGIVIDITERKQAEETLRENKARLDLALESARMAAWHWDIKENRRYFDDQVCRLLGIDPSTFTGSEEDFFRAVHPDDRETLRGTLARAVEDGAPYHPDYRAVWPDGSIHHITARALLSRDEAGRPSRISGVIWDISDRKLAEAQINASLKEKEVLLKEVQHRVKNNLLMISGILSLQLDRVKDEESKGAFITSMNRIKAMAKIHTTLYQSETYSLINFKGYMEELVRDLLRSYGFSPEDMIAAIDDISMDIDTAIPVGLIVNELVSNAVKHAFPGGRKGQIAISMTAEDSRIILSVSDNGVGFAPHTDYRSIGSVGLSLVHQLVEQINGGIERTGGEGTKFVITFPFHKE